MRLEKEQERRCNKRALHDLKVPCIKLTPPETGYPDRMYLLGFDKVLFIEWKRTANDKPTPKQLYIHDLLREQGYDVQVHYDEEEGYQAIRRAKLEAARLSKARR